MPRLLPFLLLVVAAFMVPARAIVPEPAGPAGPGAGLALLEPAVGAASSPLPPPPAPALAVPEPEVLEPVIAPAVSSPAPVEAPADVAVAAAVVDEPHVADLSDPCLAMIEEVPLAPPPGWAVTCAAGRRGLMGETDPDAQRVVVYLRSTWTVREAARVLAHELGHAYDFGLLTEADRAAWMQRRGLSGGWGSGCPEGSTCGDLDVPAGDWAESVGEAMVPGTGMWSGHLAGPPDDRDLALLRSILGAHGATL